jgi:hypothetical protein
MSGGPVRSFGLMDSTNVGFPDLRSDNSYV